jgi:hypothetical protein
MEIPQENYLYSYLYLKQAKLSLFSSTKSGNRRVEQVLSPRGVVSWGGGRWWGAEVGGYILYKKCVHMYVHAKMIPVETIPGMWKG